MRARDEPRGAIATGGAGTGHEEPDAVVAAYFVRGNGGVVDMADDIVPVQGLRIRARPNFEDGGVVELGVTGAPLLSVAQLQGAIVCGQRYFWPRASPAGSPTIRESRCC